MSIHIGNFRCKNCQQGFTNEKKLVEHAASCSNKSEDHTTADEDNTKNDNDEKGSLIADETSVIEEMEEADFESEGEGSRDIEDSDNSRNSEDSDSGSNNSSSDEEEEGEETEEKPEEEEEEEEENESDAKTELTRSRSTSRVSGDYMSCNSDETYLDEAKVFEHGMQKQIESQINRYRIYNENLQGTPMEKNVEDQNINLATITAAEQTNSSNLNNVSIPSVSATVDKLEALHREESIKAAATEIDLSDDNENESENEENNEENNENYEEEEEEQEEEQEEEEEDKDEGENDSEVELEVEAELEAEAEGEAEAEHEDEDEDVDEDENEDEEEIIAETEEEAEEEDEEENDEDDGPPVLSPIMPLLAENESEEHRDTTAQTRHKLSPIVSLNVIKELEECEITEIQNDGENVEASSHTSNFFTANNNDLSVTWDEELDEQDCDSDDDREKKEKYGKEYEKIEMNEDFEENSADGSGRDGEDNQVHEIHDLDGTVLVVTNDAEGNQILIEQNVLDIDNDDSNAEETQYIYPETAYEIEEDYTSRNETDAMQTDEIQSISFQDMSENEDSTEENSIEEISSDVK